MLPLEIFLMITSSSYALASAPQEILAAASDINTSQPTFNYQCFNHTTYPPPQLWLPFDHLWSISSEQILSSNAGNTYLQHYILSAIQKISSESNIDARLILALIMGETLGNAATPCIGNIPRCGILDAWKGSSFNEWYPEESIVQMIRDGIMSSSKRGLGYAQILKGKPRVAGVEVGDPFAAARAYHHHSALEDDDKFVNDFANRLVGWNGRGQGFEKC